VSDDVECQFTTRIRSLQRRLPQPVARRQSVPVPVPLRSVLCRTTSSGYVASKGACHSRTTPIGSSAGSLVSDDVERIRGLQRRLPQPGGRRQSAPPKAPATASRTTPISTSCGQSCVGPRRVSVHVHDPDTWPPKAPATAKKRFPPVAWSVIRQCSGIILNNV
jgi:hypothetical protein